MYLNVLEMSEPIETPKDIATRLAATAIAQGVKFPKVWDEKQTLQKCYATLCKKYPGIVLNVRML